MLSHFESPSDVNKQCYMIQDAYIKETFFSGIARSKARLRRGYLCRWLLCGCSFSPAKSQPPEAFSLQQLSPRASHLPFFFFSSPLSTSLKKESWLKWAQSGSSGLHYLITLGGSDGSPVMLLSRRWRQAIPPSQLAR